MDTKQIANLINIGTGLTALVGTIVGQVLQIRVLAQAAGASDAQLDELDGRLSAAIAARQAEQPPTE